jgi:subfamily B ATP-binding cassette protein MsbA
MGIYRRAMAYFRHDWRRITLLVLLIGVSVLIGLIEPWPAAVLIDDVLGQRTRGDFIHRAILSLLPADKVGQIVGLVVIGFAVQLVGYVVWMARMMINCHLNYRGTARVRADLFAALQRIGLAYHRSRPQGDAIFRMTADVLGPWGIMDIAIGTSVAAVTLSVMTTILLSRSVPLTLAAFAVAPFMIGSNWVFARRIHARALLSKQADTAVTTCVQQAMAHVGLTQAFRRETHELGRYMGSVQRSIDCALQLNWQEQLYPLSRDTILALGGAIILGYGGYLVYRDQSAAPADGGMTVGTLLVFLDYVRKLWDPLKWLTEFIAKVQYHVAASGRVFEVLDAPAAVSDAPAAAPLATAPRALTLQRVRFGYRDGHPILEDVSVHIQPGQMVAFLGPSGAGKSTLLHLLLRFYDPTHGALLLDGLDFRALRLADLRRHMALCAQDSALLPVSIAENIAYGHSCAPRAAIERAARLAGAAAFIEALPDGYDTLVAEGGQNLSGGQRQRIAIARALLTEAPILILDEPTSAVDRQQEELLMGTLAALKGLRTIILVTHRLESVSVCDQIFVLQGGRIAEQGTHLDLLAQGRHYARMRCAS